MVEKGDTLHSLAKKKYGFGFMWRWIYFINPTITNPNKIYEGQMIKL